MTVPQIILLPAVGMYLNSVTVCFRSPANASHPYPTICHRTKERQGILCCGLQDLHPGPRDSHDALWNCINGVQGALWNHINGVQGALWNRINGVQGGVQAFCCEWCCQGANHDPFQAAGGLEKCTSMLSSVICWTTELHHLHWKRSWGKHPASALHHQASHWSNGPEGTGPLVVPTVGSCGCRN